MFLNNSLMNYCMPSHGYLGHTTVYFLWYVWPKCKICYETTNRKISLERKFHRFFGFWKKKQLKSKFLQNLINLLTCKIKFLLKFLPSGYNGDTWSSPNFTSNIKRIWGNYLTSILSEIIKKPMVLGGIKVNSLKFA